MTEERFQEIMEGDSHLEKYEKDNTLLGLIIISKYLPNSGVEAAEHDIIYACDTPALVAAGITEEDAAELRSLNWMFDTEYDCLACFV